MKKTKLLPLLAFAIPTSILSLSMIESPIIANANETNSINWIKNNWLNYPDTTGQWTVATINGKTALGSTKNVQWTGYLNTHAMQTMDANFNFKMYQNENADDDNMGWTFRHSYTGDYKKMTNHSYYVFISNGVSKNGALIPSGIYKKTIGKNANKTDLELLFPINHRRSTYTEYEVTIDVKDEENGTRIKAYINDDYMGEYLDTNPLKSGGYGPFTNSQAHAYYYDINVNGASFLNIPPTTVATTDFVEGQVLESGDTVSVSGYAYDENVTTQNKVNVYYKIDNGEEIEIPTTTNANGQEEFDTDIVIPDNLKYGTHTIYVYSRDSEKGESAKKEIKFGSPDKVAPKVSHTLSQEEITEEDITITVKATDGESGIKRIKLPNGNYVTDSTVSMTVKENGDYTFLVEDNQGNIAPYVVTVGNVKLKQEYMVKVLGTFESTTIDIRIPSTTLFIYNPNTEALDTQDIIIESYTNAPVSMKLSNIKVSEDSKWQPKIVPFDTYTDAEWRNLINAQSSAFISLGLEAVEGNSWLKDVDSPVTWKNEDTDKMETSIGTIKNHGKITTKPLVKAGNSLSGEEYLSVNYIFEFDLK